MISPYEKNVIGAIEKAITASDLGISPTNDGTVIRLAFPPLTEERRKEMVKIVRHKAEEGRVQIRNVRRHARQELEHADKDQAIGADEIERVREGAREDDPRRGGGGGRAPHAQGAGAT